MNLGSVRRVKLMLRAFRSAVLNRLVAEYPEDVCWDCEHLKVAHATNGCTRAGCGCLRSYPQEAAP